MLPRSPAEALEPTRPPDPPEREPRGRRMHPFLALINGLLTLLFVTSLLLIGLLYFVRVQFDRPGPLATSTVVVVPKGEGVSGIAEQLERDGVIADRSVFVSSALYFIYFKGHASLKAGNTSSANMRACGRCSIRSSKVSRSTTRSPLWRE